MKELSIEQKAKRYNEAIEKAKSKINNDKDHVLYEDDVIEIFPELKESKDDRVRKELLEHCKNQAEPYILTENKCPQIQSWIDWLEKQGEQKPADKFEPKFKDGNWITNSIETVQITGYDIDYGYQVDYKGMLQHRDTDIIEKEYHLWTIKDAKDGDVIYSRHNIESFEWIGIFKSLDKENKRVFFYGFWHDMAKTFSVCRNEAYVLYDDFSPATKEQRELLFKKMKEAGYEWDTEKKELKKIENEIEIPFGSKYNELQEATYYIPKGFRAEIDNDKVVIKKREQKHAWSEEDEKIAKTIINEFETCSEWCCANGLTKEDCIAWLNRQIHAKWSEENKKKVNNLYVLLDQMVNFNMLSNKDASEFKDWLKSIKDRYTWKPSDEQLDALEHFVRSIGESGYVSPYDNNTKLLYSLLFDLKKLRDE